MVWFRPQLLDVVSDSLCFDGGIVRGVLQSNILSEWSFDRGSFADTSRSTFPRKQTIEQPRHNWSDDTHALRDRLWLIAVDHLDAVLRTHYGVEQYTNAPQCVFRIALAKASRSVRLADGTLIQTGDPIGSLHFWNEHLPPFPPSGPDLHWAKLMRGQVRHSLELLCQHVQREPAWRSVEALRADAPLPFRPLARQQMLRLASRHGFEAEDTSGHAGSHTSSVAHNLLLWGLARAYNPSALTRFSLRQERQPLWLSRRSLLDRYGSAGRGVGGAAETAGEGACC